MPSLRADAPDNVPDSETLEYLLGKRNLSNRETKKTKTLGQLSLEERLKTGIASLSRRNVYIDGDPHGVSPVWAGNVGHPHDQHMFEVMIPLFVKLNEAEFVKNNEERIQQLRKLLESVRHMAIEDLARRFASDDNYSTSHVCEKEVTVAFKMGMHYVKVMQLHDVHKDVAWSFRTNARAKASAKELDDAFQEAPMPVQSQKYLMAKKLESMGKHLPEESRPRTKYMDHLRIAVQEQYWTQMTLRERDETNTAATSNTTETLRPYIDDLETDWPTRWNNRGFDRDYYHQYTQDTFAAKHV